MASAHCQVSQPVSPAEQTLLVKSILAMERGGGSSRGGRLGSRLLGSSPSCALAGREAAGPRFLSRATFESFFGGLFLLVRASWRASGSIRVPLGDYKGFGDNTKPMIGNPEKQKKY